MLLDLKLRPFAAQQRQALLYLLPLCQILLPVNNMQRTFLVLQRAVAARRSFLLNTGFSCTCATLTHKISRSRTRLLSSEGLRKYRLLANISYN
jgi:hypothetical protein